jgi:acyl-CoA dehydrogenase
MMDFTLPEELRILREQLRRFVDTEIIPHERETLEDSGDELKPEWRARLVKGAKDLGIWMMEVPEEYGGPGADLTSVCIVKEEIAKVSESAALLAANGDYAALWRRQTRGTSIGVAE